ncbi:MAG: hypothetical protein HN919_18575 [Verrucomicrobia bacterium]|nr:hypothetical protein [Verrucomicrobiota bacterium]
MSVLKELPELRSAHSKTFDLGDRRRRMVAVPRRLHTRRRDSWQDIALTMSKTGVLCGAPFKARLLPKRIGYKGTTPNGKAVGLEILDHAWVKPEIDVRVTESDGISTAVVHVLYKNVAPDYDVEFIFTEERVACWQHLHSKKAPHVCRFDSLHEPLAEGKVFTQGIDSRSRETDMHVKREALSDSRTILTVTFNGKVKTRKAKSRKETLSDATYPVAIDPSTSFSVTSANHMGYAQLYMNSTNATWYPASSYATTAACAHGGQYSGWYPSEHRRVWMRFAGLTIPQGSTITSAELKAYISAVWGNGTGSDAILYMDNDSVPGLPSTWGDFASDSSLIPKGLMTKTGSAWSFASSYHTMNSAFGAHCDYVTQVQPFATHSEVGGTTPPTDWQMTFPVTTEFAALVSQYDYDPGAVQFYFIPSMEAHPIVIDTQNVSGREPKFVVDYTLPPAEAPTVTLGAATSVAATTATINGTVTEDGYEAPTVTMYWGKTNGLQVPGNWTNSSSPTNPGQPQGEAAFLKNLTGLDPSTLYYFSAEATNSGGTDWPAASLSFTTGAAGWTGTIGGVTDPGSVGGVDVEDIDSIGGV